MDHSVKAAELFSHGWNCAQAVALAFCDVTGLEEQTMVRLASPFGGGMGRMRQVCGAFSGMLMVLGLLYGYDDADNQPEKQALYEDVQALAAQFQGEIGSIICGDILENPSKDPTPSPRTEEYYQKRPCGRVVSTAARLLDAFIAEHPPKN